MVALKLRGEKVKPWEAKGIMTWWDKGGDQFGLRKERAYWILRGMHHQIRLKTKQVSFFFFFFFLEEKSFKHVLFNFLHILLMIISPSISFPSILLRFENYLWLVWMHRPHRLLVVIDWMIIEDDWLFILRIYFTHYFSLFSFT